MIHFSENFKLVELVTLQVIVGSYGQNADLEEKMKSSQPEFYANALLSSTVLCTNCIFVNPWRNFDIL